jgi:two-component system, sensor histidine kinase YesM
MPLKALTARILRKLNMSIRLKILVIFVFSAILPLGNFGLISYNSYFNTIQETVSSNSSELANQLNRNLELFFNNINTILDSGNETLVINYLDETDPDAKYAYAKEIGVRFGLYKAIFDYESIVQDTNIIGLSSNAISSRKGVYYYPSDLTQNSIFQKALADPEKPHVFAEDTAHTEALRRIDEKDVISVAKIIRRQLTREVKGLMIVDIQRKAIEDICSNIKLGETGNFIVVDQNNHFIYYPEFQINRKHTVQREILNKINGIEEGYFIENINGEKHFVVYNNLVLFDWKIVGIVKLSEIMGTAIEIRKWTIIIELLLVAGVFMLFLLITKTMTWPIRDLRTQMKMAEAGNLDVEATFKYNDELSELSKGFNLMITNIRELMDKNTQQQENLKKLEFKALQAQINPHFLYNTLDAIVWTAEADKKEEVIRLAKHLSTFFRVALSKGKEWVLVEEELLHVKSYLSIQQVRYRDILKYRIDVEEEIRNASILKLILQPLVENALYHGIKNKRGGGEIYVKGKKDGKQLVFEVSDTGIGMSEEKRHMIMIVESAKKTNLHPCTAASECSMSISEFSCTTEISMD